MDKARETAIKVLHEVHSNGAYANVALVQALRRAALNEADRRFVTELVYGIVKAGDTLDWMLQRYVNRPLSKMPPMIQEILRLGLYQIFFLDKVPASAACNEAVELTKRYGHAGTRGFVNAVLRTAVREPEKAVFPKIQGQEAQYLALSAQHPVWLVKKWIAAFGYEETAKLCAFDNTAPVLSVRTNTLKTDREALLRTLSGEGVEAAASNWAPEGILFGKHGALDALPSLQQGLFQVQDESSMQVAHVIDPQPGEFVLDVCSAPGGKTTHMAALMKNQGHILAVDIYEGKLARLMENAVRLGVSIVETKCQDARTIGAVYAGQADRVLVDAPCSGLGVLRRKPDARWRKTPAELAALPELQLAILRSAALAVKPGGVLIYSTCTITEEENSGVVRAFLDEQPNFALEITGDFLPVKRRSDSMVQLYPQHDGTDGFFIARMKRRM